MVLFYCNSFSLVDFFRLGKKLRIAKMSYRYSLSDKYAFVADSLTSGLGYKIFAMRLYKKLL